MALLPKNILARTQSQYFGGTCCTRTGNLTGCNFLPPTARGEPLAASSCAKAVQFHFAPRDLDRQRRLHSKFMTIVHTSMWSSENTLKGQTHAFAIAFHSHC